VSLDVYAKLFYGFTLDPAEVSRIRIDDEEGDFYEALAARWLKSRGLELFESWCAIGPYGGNADGRVFICIHETLTVACGANINQISSIEVHPLWDKKLKEFCDSVRLTYKEPQWLLVAYQSY
jgi:hypothetical protein